MKISTILPCGGESKRCGCDKLIQKLNGKEVILYSVEKFLKLDDVFEIIVVVQEKLIEQFSSILRQYNKVKLVLGGETRQESVYNGLVACNNPNLVIIHDGARPLIKIKTIEKCIESALKTKASIVGVKMIDTIKTVDSNCYIQNTLNRDCLFKAQTPQIFDYNLILSAHTELKDGHFTDDASMIEFLHHDVKIVEGDYSNIKITTPIDFHLASLLLHEFLEDDNV